ncbi:hypothetical protein H696_00208 [Fonticula alba]|uniref:50S ribosomal protein L35 n=1 Tax=Fonticula alba TaxID=691883 RepID=A0A058ZE32_FONAL|nr:hypothetical protein H696_00208 [Fonticula alba]KCV72624.1 hypothetical protein H696_00208 [Fonticula alba]|eukprot:XP_009492325.1 hypothetical protein H696_00208 [Fonticula alba]
MSFLFGRFSAVAASAFSQTQTLLSRPAASLNNLIPTVQLRNYSFKTHSATKKRFRLTGNGDKFKYEAGGKRHLATGKSRQEVGILKKNVYTNKTQTSRIRKFLFNSR